MSLRTDLAQLVANKALAGATTVMLLAGGGAVVALGGVGPSQQGVEHATRIAGHTASDEHAPPQEPGSQRPEHVAADLDALLPPDLPGRPELPDPAAQYPTGRPTALSGPETAQDQRDGGVSDQVHEALSGGDLRPGDEGFGQAVAERARSGGADLGAEVSAAARVNEGTAGNAGTAATENDATGDGTLQDAAAGADDTAVRQAPAGPPASAGTGAAPKTAPDDRGRPASDSGSRP